MSLAGLDLRHSARHATMPASADELGRRLLFLLEAGFTITQADHVFETVELPAIDNIRGKLSDLRALGFADPVKMVTSLPAIDPVKMVTSSPAILGYAPERVRLCGKIVAGLDDGTPPLVAKLLRQRRTTIDAVAAAGCRTRRELAATIKAAKGEGDAGMSAATKTPILTRGANARSFVMLRQQPEPGLTARSQGARRAVSPHRRVFLWSGGVGSLRARRFLVFGLSTRVRPITLLTGGDRVSDTRRLAMPDSARALFGHLLEIDSCLIDLVAALAALGLLATRIREPEREPFIFVLRLAAADAAALRDETDAAFSEFREGSR